MALGVYPVITLSAARDAHMDARRMLAEGLDPANEKQNRKKLIETTVVAPVLNSFKETAWRWFEKWKAAKDETYVANTETRLKEGILSKIGDHWFQGVTICELA